MHLAATKAVMTRGIEWEPAAGINETKFSNISALGLHDGVIAFARLTSDALTAGFSSCD